MSRTRKAWKSLGRRSGGVRSVVPQCRCAGRCRCGGLVPSLLLREIELECEFYRAEL